MYLQFMTYNDRDFLIDACIKSVYDFNDHTRCVGKLTVHDQLYLY